jgi:hypothetical protein
MDSRDDKLADEAGAKVALAIAKTAAARALEEGLDRRKRNKRIVVAVIGLLVAVGLIGLLLHYWYWSLLLGLVGAAALYGRHRWRASRARRLKPEEVAAHELPPKKVRIDPAPSPPTVNEEEGVDEELAELKARLKR